MAQADFRRSIEDGDGVEAPVGSNVHPVDEARGAPISEPKGGLLEAFAVTAAAAGLFVAIVGIFLAV